MFALPFGRILWKEYRSHQALWLALMAIGVLLQIWFLGLALFDSTLSSQPGDYRVDFVVVVTGFIPVMYAIGSAAVLFAGERESSTCNWLIGISAPPLPTLAAKLTFAILSSTLMQFLLAATAFILIAVAQVKNLESIQSFKYILFPACLAALVWAVFGSLLSRKVVSSVVAMALWFLIPAWFLGLSLDMLPRTHMLQSTTIPYHLWFLGIVVFFADLVIGWRWIEGMYWDGALLEYYGDVARKSWAKVTRREHVASRLPLAAELDDLGRRSWQRLIWQERHRERFFFRLIFTGCGLLAAFLCMARSAINQTPDGIIAGSLGVVLMGAFLMGILCFQVDSHHQQPRFLANRGISPSPLWNAKQFVWLTRSLMILALCTVIAAVYLCYVMNATEPGKVVTVLSNYWGVIGSRGRVAFTIDAILWPALLAYACGQLASHLFRRTVLALAAGLILGSVFGMWGQFVMYLGFSFWWTLGLPAIGLLWITRWQMSGWLLEDESWVRRGQIAASLIAMPVAMLMLVVIARVTEPMMAEPLWAHFRTTFDSQVATFEGWNSNSHLVPTVQGRLDLLGRTQEADAKGVAKSISDLISQNEYSLVWTEIPEHSAVRTMQEEWGPYRVKHVLETASQQFLSEGKLDESLDCSLAILKLAGNLGNGETSFWIAGVKFQAVCLEQLIDWANHPSQTPDSLWAGIEKIEQQLAKYTQLSDAVVRTYIKQRKEWVRPSTSDLLDRMLKESPNAKSLSAHTLIWMTFLNSAERARFNKLLDRNAEVNFQEAMYAELSCRANGPINSFMATHDEHFRELNAQMTRTTPLFDWMGEGKTPQTDLVKFRYAVQRAGLIRLKLIAYRLEHGELPERITQLAPPPNAEGKLDPAQSAKLMDPWTQQLFDFFPAFLYSSGPLRHRLTFLSKNQLEIGWRSGPTFITEMFFELKNDLNTNYTFVMNGSAEQIKEQFVTMRSYKGLVGSTFPIPPKPEAAPVENPAP